MQSVRQPIITDLHLPFVAKVGILGTFLRHSHEETEILYLLSGEAEVLLESETFTVGPGDIVLIARNEPHEIRVNPQQALTRHLLLEFGQQLLADEYALLAGRRFLRPFLRPDAMTADDPLYGPAQQLKRLLCRAESELQSPQDGQLSAVRGLLCELFVCMVRTLPTAEAPELERSFWQQHRWAAVLEYITAHCMEQITMEEAAERAGYSAYHFCRSFRAHVGVPFHQYVNRYRVDRAAALLADQTLSVTQIASMSGFDSIKTFNRGFRQQTGMSPTQFRHAQQP